jgi:hypothetical protein
MKQLGYGSDGFYKEYANKIKPFSVSLRASSVLRYQLGSEARPSCFTLFPRGDTGRDSDLTTFCQIKS